MTPLILPHPGTKADPDRTWCTDYEMDLFRRMRATGSSSFFRSGVCRREGCDTEIPDAKLYCSRRCHDDDADTKGNDHG